MLNTQIRHLAFRLQNNIVPKLPGKSPKWMSKTFQSDVPKRCLSAVPRSISRQPENPDWREAASLMITAKDQQVGSEYDYSMLMVKRSRGSSFMASAYVFPGGVVEQCDFDASWYDLFAKNGIDQRELDMSISGKITGPRLPMVKRPVTTRNAPDSGRGFLNPDVAFRINAIRETFEEAGVLLLINAKNRDQSEQSAVSLSDNELEEWQKKVRSDSKQFYAFCQHANMVPNVWSLHEWSNWLTPVMAHNRRFDTLFYVCQLGQQPKVRIDNAEVTKTVWCHPESILSDFQQDKVKLAPPQIYEISKFHKFRQIDELKQFTSQRQTLGTERWMPFMFSFDDGELAFVLPGDFRYPQDGDLIRKEYDSEVKGSVDDDVNLGPLNRTVIKAGKSRTVCNVDPGCGHLRPIHLDD